MTTPDYRSNARRDLLEQNRIAAKKTLEGIAMMPEVYFSIDEPRKKHLRDAIQSSKGSLSVDEQHDAYQKEHQRQVEQSETIDDALTGIGFTRHEINGKHVAYVRMDGEMMDVLLDSEPHTSKEIICRYRTPRQNIEEWYGSLRHEVDAASAKISKKLGKVMYTSVGICALGGSLGAVGTQVPLGQDLLHTLLYLSGGLLVVGSAIYPLFTRTPLFFVSEPKPSSQQGVSAAYAKLHNGALLDVCDLPIPDDVVLAPPGIRVEEEQREVLEADVDAQEHDKKMGAHP